MGVCPGAVNSTTLHDYYDCREIDRSNTSRISSLYREKKNSDPRELAVVYLKRYDRIYKSSSSSPTQIS